VGPNNFNRPAPSSSFVVIVMGKSNSNSPPDQHASNSLTAATSLNSNPQNKPGSDSQGRFCHCYSSNCQIIGQRYTKIMAGPDPSLIKADPPAGSGDKRPSSETVVDVIHDVDGKMVEMLCPLPVQTEGITSAPRGADDNSTTIPFYNNCGGSAIMESKRESKTESTPITQANPVRDTNSTD
jgi:hypothetical protein